MKKLCLFLVLLSALSTVQAIDNQRAEADRTAILALHAKARQAHLQGDAALLASGMADTVLMIQNGAIQQKTREEVQSGFAKYFASVTYSAWDDVVPPAVNVSKDGRMAWAAIQIRATLRDNSGAASTKREFLSSWISTYAKEGSRWRMVAISSGCDPACGSSKATH